jgi:hypothetical protein
MRSRRTEPSIDAGSDPAQQLTPPVDDADYCCSGEGSAMSAVNHRFPLAVRLAETFASASRTSLWMGPGKLAKSNAEQVARARQIAGKAAIV